MGKQFFELKPKMHFILASDSTEYKKAKDINKNVVGKINHDEYKNVLFNKKCLRKSKKT